MSDITLRSLIASRATESPDRPFLADLQRTFSYAQVHQRVQAVAARVAAAGITKGQSVGFAGNNSIELAISILGLFYGGYRATAINLVAGTETIDYVLSHADCRLILQDDAGESVLALSSHAANLPRLSIVESTQPEFRHTTTPPLLCAQDDGLLMYTSGTTGRPKGVRLSHANLLAGGNNTAMAHQLTAQDKALCSLPLYHINALCVTVLAPLVSGGSVVFTPKFSTPAFWPTIHAQQCTWFSLVPTQIGYLLSADEALPDMPKLRFGRSASAPLSPDVQAAFEARFAVPVIETMGLTETAAQILSNPLPPGVRKIGSPGIAFGNDVRIVDKQHHELPPETEGEICIKGPNVMLGYLNNEQATQEAIDADGWLHTGDLGKIDKDGYIFVTGRIKELIIKGGENIAPREVDEAMLSHPAILEAAAFASDCSRYGQTVLAAAVTKPGQTVDQEALIDHCKQKIGAFKAPLSVYFLDELPKGPSGKVQRLKLASQLL